MKRILIIISITGCFLFGCSSYGVDFKVKNNSGRMLDSISISNGLSTVNLSIIPNDGLYELYLDFKNNEKIKGDGSYQIIIYEGNKENTTNFGYFTNGIPLANEYEILIEKDTILFVETINN